MKKDKKEGMEDLLEKLKEVLKGNDLLEALKKTAEELKEISKPKFVIEMRTHDDDTEGYHIAVEGNKYSLKVALTELAGELLSNTNLTAEDIREAVEIGLTEEVEE